jgi:unsaturated chondroitin disaccharide hydrolase
VCGFQELARRHAVDPTILQAKSALLDRLCSDTYLNFDESCAGIQKHGQVGDGNPGGALEVYTSWGDYFLMEALSRELNQGETFW